MPHLFIVLHCCPVHCMIILPPPPGKYSAPLYFFPSLHFLLTPLHTSRPCSPTLFVYLLPFIFRCCLLIYLGRLVLQPALEMIAHHFLTAHPGCDAFHLEHVMGGGSAWGIRLRGAHTWTQGMGNLLLSSYLPWQCGCDLKTGRGRVT